MFIQERNLILCALLRTDIYGTMALNFTPVFVSPFTLCLGNLSHALGTTSQRLQASGQQPCPCRMVRNGRGSDKLPSSTLGVRIDHCTFETLRHFHQRCLWSPGITWMLQGNIGPWTSCFSLLSKSTWLHHLLKGAGVEGACPALQDESLGMTAAAKEY